VIDVRRDFAGLKIAAAELYIESFLRPDLEASLIGCDPERAVEAVSKTNPPRSVSQGYYLWVMYLMWLKSVMGLPGQQIELYGDEAEGLLVLADAERAFRKEHPSCYKCGALNMKHAGSCRECGAEFKE
jgi:hypothetical protein